MSNYQLVSVGVYQNKLPTKQLMTSISQKRQWKLNNKCIQRLNLRPQWITACDKTSPIAGLLTSLARTSSGVWVFDILCSRGSAFWTVYINNNAQTTLSEYSKTAVELMCIKSSCSADQQGCLSKSAIQDEEILINSKTVISTLYFSSFNIADKNHKT